MTNRAYDKDDYATDAECWETFEDFVQSSRIPIRLVVPVPTGRAYDKGDYATDAECWETFQAYSDPSRESDVHAQPDLEIFYMSPHALAASDDELMFEYGKRPEFYRADVFNGGVEAAMIDAIVQEEGITGGWCYWFCFPDCLPHSAMSRPFPSYDEALSFARKGLPSWAK